MRTATLNLLGVILVQQKCLFAFCAATLVSGVFLVTPLTGLF